VRGTRTARRGIDIQSYTELGNQAQTLRMIIENQNASYGSALNFGWDRSRDDREDSLFI